MISCCLAVLDVIVNRLHKAAHREEVNWAPRSDVMTAGTQNLPIHSSNKAFAQFTVVVATIGIFRPARSYVCDSEQVW
jgi:hypothetical protein